MRLIISMFFLLYSVTSVAQIFALELVSRYASGQPMQRLSRHPAITADGRYVLFQSRDRDLFPSGVAPTVYQYFLRDRQRGTLQLLSANANGEPMNGFENGADISDDGNIFVFATGASNILPVSPSVFSRGYVLDRRNGSIRLLRGTASELRYAGQIVVSGDGRYVLSICEPPAGSKSFYVFCRIDLDNGDEVVATRDLAGQPFGPNLIQFARLSKDGHSTVYGIDQQVIHHDLRTGAVRRVSTSITGGPANFLSYQPRISRDGRYVVFASSATNLFPGLPEDAFLFNQVYLWDRNTERLQLVSIRADGLLCFGEGCNDPDVSDDGRYVVFRNSGPDFSISPLNFYYQSLLVDLHQPGVFRTVSVNLAGQVANLGAQLVQGCTMFCSELEYAPRISGNGRFVTYQSESTNLLPGVDTRTPRIFVAQVQLDDPVILPLSASLYGVLVLTIAGLGALLLRRRT